MRKTIGLFALLLPALCLAGDPPLTQMSGSGPWTAALSSCQGSFSMRRDGAAMIITITGSRCSQLTVRPASGGSVQIAETQSPAVRPGQARGPAPATASAVHRFDLVGKVWTNADKILISTPGGDAQDLLDFPIKKQSLNVQPFVQPFGGEQAPAAS